MLRATARLSTLYVPDSMACLTLATLSSSTTGISFAFAFSLATSSFQPDNFTWSNLSADPWVTDGEEAVSGLAEEDTGKFCGDCNCLSLSIFMIHPLIILSPRSFSPGLSLPLFCCFYIHRQPPCRHVRRAGCFFSVAFATAGPIFSFDV